MASVTAYPNLQDFPVATVLNVYLRSAWTNPSVPPKRGVAPPSGASVVTTGTIASDGHVDFTGLADGTEYVYGKQVSSEWRYTNFSTPVPSAAGGDVTAEASTRAAADADLAAVDATKQDAATAATDTELAAEASTRGAADTTEASARATADALKQDAATAATDTELASEASARGSADTTEASARAAADALKQDASTAATDTELASEASSRSSADASEASARAARDAVAVIEKADDTTVVAPCPVLIHSGTFTPAGTDCEVEIDLQGVYYEGSAGWAGLDLYYGLASTFTGAGQAMNYGPQAASPPAGSTRVVCSGVTAYNHATITRVKLTGLTAGAQYRFDLTASIVGGAKQTSGLDGSVAYLSCAQAAYPGVYDYLVAARGTSKIVVLLVNHQDDVNQAQIASADPVDATTATRLAITPDGTKVVVPNYASNSVSVYDSLTLALLGTYALPGGVTGPGGAICSPDSTKAYIRCGSGHVQVMTVASGAMGTSVSLGGADANSHVSITPDGSKVFAPLTTAGTVKVIQTSDNTVAATWNPPFVGTMRNVAVDPAGVYAYVIAGTNIYKATIATNVIAAALSPYLAAGVTPQKGIVSSDGATLFVCSSNATGHIHHFMLATATLQEWTHWGNSLAGDATQPLTDLELTPNCSIMAQGSKASSINIWHGGKLQFFITAGSFFRNHCRVLVRGAS